ncbi:hypothetical protein NE236_41670 [Actinoallomurus purpureus]|uniref:hypothetical protein n=1 Tax=Actinoallomurus purpureus TaxID=478114 RepID=UPI002092E80A|nr:hypothetical protein [Actinoallomurus purpureus]MCO6011479.1 hypothetical protein [Actinoallomurus purpureus]
MTLTAFLRRRRARRTYSRASHAVVQIHAELYTTSDPATRAELLDQFADIEQAMSRSYRAAFGPDRLPGEGCRDMAEVHAAAADLALMLADTERALTEGPPNSTVFRRPGSRPGEVETWEQLAAAQDRATRADLINQLYLYVAQRAGAQAASSLASHAYTERELAAASHDFDRQS